MQQSTSKTDLVLIMQARTSMIILQDQGRDGPAAPPRSQWFNRSLGDGWAGSNGRHPRAVVKDHAHRTAVGSAFAGINTSQITISPTSASGHVLDLKARQEATVITALASNREFLFQNDADPDEPLKFVGEKLTRFTKLAELESLTTAHNAWWTRYWKEKSGVQFGLDPDGKLSIAERLWYGTMYMLTITNRANYTTHTPPSGLWHNFYTADQQGWPGYTTDINTQSPYFGAAAANHAETTEAMIDLHGAQHPRNIDYSPTRWPQSPWIVMQCAPSAPNAPNHLGFCALQTSSSRWADASAPSPSTAR